MWTLPFGQKSQLNWNHTHLLGFRILLLACKTVKRLFHRFRLDWAIAMTSAICWQFVAAMVIAMSSMKVSKPWVMVICLG